MRRLKLWLIGLPPGLTIFAGVAAFLVIVYAEGFGPTLALWLVLLAIVPTIALSITDDRDWATMAFFGVIVLVPLLVTLRL